MHSAAEFAAEPVLAQQSVVLHVTDHRLDHLAAFEQFFQLLGQAPRVADQQPCALWCLDAVVAPVGQRDLRHVADRGYRTQLLNQLPRGQLCSRLGLDHCK